MVEVQYPSVLAVTEGIVWGQDPERRKSSLSVTSYRDPVLHGLSVSCVDRASTQFYRSSTSEKGVGVSVETPSEQDTTSLRRRGTSLLFPGMKRRFYPDHPGNGFPHDGGWIIGTLPGEVSVFRRVGHIRRCRHNRSHTYLFPPQRER